MRYYHVDGHLIAETDDRSRAVDLTAARPELGQFRDLARVAGAADVTIDTLASRHLEAGRSIDHDQLTAADVPCRPPEVWAAGVTYLISEQAREGESQMPEMYLDVYDADRPELFFKATPSRTVGPGEAVGIRQDSNWDVPEPELGIVLYRGEAVGYTIGNDMSSRDIEGQNPLYLPQAKVYDRCCALGPCVASAETVGDPHDLDMTMSIRRAGETVYEETTNTGEMVRTCEDLAAALAAHNRLPNLTVLLTGTALVPPDEFTLRPDDDVVIDIDQLGRLTNPVVEV
ncbi:MAG: fumarylacetoacetate hydrolase family protein [Halobacteriaceae archaeon]